VRESMTKWRKPCKYAKLKPLQPGSHNLEGYCEKQQRWMIAWLDCEGEDCPYYEP